MKCLNIQPSNLKISAQKSNFQVIFPQILDFYKILPFGISPNSMFVLCSTVIRRRHFYYWICTPTQNFCEIFLFYIQEFSVRVIFSCVNCSLLFFTFLSLSRLALSSLRSFSLSLAGLVLLTRRKLCSPGGTTQHEKRKTS